MTIPDPGESDRGNAIDRSSVLRWPRDAELAAEEAVETSCAHCGQAWQIHRDLSGFRLRCACGEWVPVPYRAALVESTECDSPATLTDSAHSVRHDYRSLSLGSSDDLPDPTARQIDRGILELIAILFALLSPSVIWSLYFGVESTLQMLPILQVASGVMVLLVGVSTGQFGFDGLRGAKPRYYLEAVAVGCLFFGVALLLSQLVSTVNFLEDLGLPLALFAVALCPAIFEEIAFRGILQGRLITLLGTKTGIAVVAVVFALAHGVSFASPIHFAIGLYLGVLRQRSGSLAPGMLLHGLYNGAVILVDMS